MAGARRTFTREFKGQILRLMVQKTATVKELCLVYELKQSVVYAWRAKAVQTGQWAQMQAEAAARPAPPGRAPDALTRETAGGTLPQNAGRPPADANVRPPGGSSEFLGHRVVWGAPAPGAIILPEGTSANDGSHDWKARALLAALEKGGKA